MYKYRYISTVSQGRKKNERVMYMSICIDELNYVKNENYFNAICASFSHRVIAVLSLK